MPLSNVEDPWLGRDKLYHAVSCLSLVLFFSKLASLTPHPFLQRHSISVGYVLALFVGAAKEAGDELGIFPSAGASFRDAVADVVGVLVAAFGFFVCRSNKTQGGFDLGATQVTSACLSGLSGY